MLEADWLKEEEKNFKIFWETKQINNNIRFIPIIEVGVRSKSFVTTCILRRFKCIRVIDFQNSSYEALPHYICNHLKLLRYLDISNNKNIKRLPKSILKLPQ